MSAFECQCFRYRKRFIIVSRFAEVFGFRLCLIGRSVNDAGKSKIIDIVSSIMGV
jgi:hypothetical protein